MHTSDHAWVRGPAEFLTWPYCTGLTLPVSPGNSALTGAVGTRLSHIRDEAAGYRANTHSPNPLRLQPPSARLLRRRTAPLSRRSGGIPSCRTSHSAAAARAMAYSPCPVAISPGRSSLAAWPQCRHQAVTVWWAARWCAGSAGPALALYPARSLVRSHTELDGRRFPNHRDKVRRQCKSACAGAGSLKRVRKPPVRVNLGSGLPPGRHIPKEQ